ncbi:uncharacterized protein EV420DRAFT_311544 [Desarmillaria tabescens]|uniref:BTB domain-containing protein n=1 Tax=Armillaria tabescens TaxID=1929756 RepID=A0AA39KDN4_ARMTA|nr:uncharacterized protein EV420DRAFT_311544 [Desarmillaria tabescens]KAK0459262.1 hypothetical protein EV420DRAFT_311544 [Desarmillaria tabescens]
MTQTIIVPSSSSRSVCSRSVSHSRPWPPRVVNSPSPTTSRSRSLSPPPFPMPSVAIPCPSSVKYGWSEFPPCPFIPHPRFYFQDGNVNLEINGTRYKIHRHFLVMNSSVFAHELPFNIIFKSLPCDVDQQAFELVLSLFYPKDCFSGHDIQSESDWHRVLVFACRYKMILIRDMAITKVPSLDPIVKAELAAKYGLKDWLVPVYTDLCIKDLTTRKGWSAEEGKKIGLEGILALIEVKRDIVDRLGEYLDREKVMKAVEEKLEELNLI